VAEPEFLLLDEPFGALDALTRLTARRLLLDLWRQHRFGVLLVTHDVDEAVALADRVLVLDEGRVVYTLSIDEPRPPLGEATAETERYRVDLLDKLGVRI
jgi:sulfonate transport system ATP-binding protein